MSLDADLIVDRRRMRRKLTFWRVLAVAVIVLAIAGTAATWEQPVPAVVGANHLVVDERVKSVEGLIRDDEERVKQLDKLAQSSRRTRRHRACRQPRRHHRQLRAALQFADAAGRRRSRW